MISAHWYVEGLAVTAMQTPKTIHDFYGFPKELSEINYPAKGAPWLAERVVDLLSPLTVARDQEWGLDHGTWSVLRHVYPNADTPVVQLSIDRTKPPKFHHELGRRLRSLRDEGVLVAGSGNVVHNLRSVRFRADAQPFDWAVRFNAFVRQTIESGPRAILMDYSTLGDDARRSAPTPDHFLPLLTILGAAYDDEPARFFNDSIDLASVSMLGAIIAHEL
jgi:4,5-DOPA dioxygenase extradiol